MQTLGQISDNNMLFGENNDKMIIKRLPKIKRQTQMFCMICHNVAKKYDQIRCSHCRSLSKWSIPWKNEQNILTLT
jgi:hypothetical protein